MRIHLRRYLELRQCSHHKLPVALELRAGIPHQKQLSEVDVVSQGLHAAQAAHEVHRQVQFLQALTAWWAGSGNRKATCLHVYRQKNKRWIKARTYAMHWPSRFSMTSMLFKARFKYSSFFSRPTFSKQTKTQNHKVPVEAADDFWEQKHLCECFPW